MGLIGGVLNLTARVIGDIAGGAGGSASSSKVDVSDKSFKLETPCLKVEISDKGVSVELRGEKSKAPEITFNQDTFEPAPAAAPAAAPAEARGLSALRAKLSGKGGGSKLGSGTDGRGL